MPDTLFENQTASDATVGIFTTWWRAQSFTPSITHDITSVDILCYRTNTPGTVNVGIYEVDGGGDPTGSALASGSFDGDSLTTNTAGEWKNVTVSGAGSLLVATTQYAIVVGLVNNGLDSSWAVRWRDKINTNPYAGGLELRSINSGSTWNQYATDDLAFREYGLAFITKTFTVGASISKDDITKTLTVDANLVESKKTFTVQASLSQDDITKTLTADASVDIFRVPSWPLHRTAAYDPDKVWDEESKAWYAVSTAIGSARQAQAGGRYRKQVVVMSNQGKIYFGSL